MSIVQVFLDRVFHHEVSYKKLRIEVVSNRLDIPAGLNLGRLIGMVAAINPQIVPTALLGTGVVFVCFTLAALFTHKRTYLYLGGTLATGMTVMLSLSLANIFMGSRLLYSVRI